MFARIKKTGKYQYLQIVENKKIDGKARQKVLATLGRYDELQEKGRVKTLVRSLSRFSENAMMILTGNSSPDAVTIKIGPSLIFERNADPRIKPGMIPATNNPPMEVLVMVPPEGFGHAQSPLPNQQAA